MQEFKALKDSMNVDMKKIKEEIKAFGRPSAKNSIKMYNYILFKSGDMFQGKDFITAEDK